MPASYPTSLKTFTTYQNQPGPDSLVLDVARITNEIHDEVVAIETTMGPRPFLPPGQKSLGQSVQYLYYNKAPGHVGANNVIDPTQLPTHEHPHAQTTGRNADDHAQYVPASGARGFTAPISGHPSTSGNHLITWSQAVGSGLTAAQVQSIISTDLASSSDYPCTGPSAGRYKMTGGQYYGPTDGNGNVWIDFSPARFSRLVSFVYMKRPFPGESLLGWYTYQYIEDQLILLSLSTAGATVQFIEDIAVDRSALVCMTWMALGA
jgi:hypothetical protein